MEINIETLSPEQRAELQAQLAQANKVSDGEGGDDFEKRYKDTQASFTKANEEKYNLAKQLVEVNPKKVLDMDAKTQAKVIKELYGYDNLDELKIMKPDVFETKPDGSNLDMDDTTEQLKRELELLKMKTSKSETQGAIEDFINNNKEITSAIPDFAEKITDELKYISSELPARERVKRATKIVSSNNDVNVEALLALQGKTLPKDRKSEMGEEQVVKAQNMLRAQLGLKAK